MRRACSQPSLCAEPMPSLPGRTTTPTRGSAAARAASTSSVPSSRIVVDHQHIAARPQPEQAVEHRADRAALVVGADEHQRVAGFHRRRKLRTMRRRRQFGSPGLLRNANTRSGAGSKQRRGLPERDRTERHRTVVEAQRQGDGALAVDLGGLTDEVEGRDERRRRVLPRDSAKARRDAVEPAGRVVERLVDRRGQRPSSPSAGRRLARLATVRRNCP